MQIGENSNRGCLLSVDMYIHVRPKAKPKIMASSRKITWGPVMSYYIPAQNAV
jgi:hypothetical protein